MGHWQRLAWMNNRTAGHEDKENKAGMNKRMYVQVQRRATAAVKVNGMCTAEEAAAIEA